MLFFANVCNFFSLKYGLDVVGEGWPVHESPAPIERQRRFEGGALTCFEAEYFIALSAGI